MLEMVLLLMLGLKAGMEMPYYILLGVTAFTITIRAGFRLAKSVRKAQ